MLDFIAWYVIIVALGWIVFPILYFTLPSLPGRGYSLAKLFGMLAWGYLFWILGSLGVTANNLGGLFFPLLLLVGAGFWILNKKGSGGIRQWIKDHRSLIFSSEILFLLAFAAMAFVRAYNPEINGTEKPMELAFINAILGSESMPPNDPWLSGYSISYYYFGFVLVAMMAKLAGTVGGVAFNLGVSLTFALTAVGSYGVLFNLLAIRKRGWKKALLPSLLAPFFTLILSNWEGFLHYLHSRGLFWNQVPEGNPSAFWSWLDIQNLVNRPAFFISRQVSGMSVDHRPVENTACLCGAAQAQHSNAQIKPDSHDASFPDLPPGADPPFRAALILVTIHYSTGQGSQTRRISQARTAANSAQVQNRSGIFRPANAFKKESPAFKFPLAGAGRSPVSFTGLVYRDRSNMTGITMPPRAMFILRLPLLARVTKPPTRKLSKLFPFQS